MFNLKASKTTAGRRYMMRFIPTMVAYIVILVAVDWLFRNHPPQGPIRYLLAVLPALPVIGIIAAMGLYLVETNDEFERMVLVKSMLWAIGVTLSVYTVVDALMNFTGMKPLPMFALFTLFVAVFGLAQPFVRRGYR